MKRTFDLVGNKQGSIYICKNGVYVEDKSIFGSSGEIHYASFSDILTIKYDDNDRKRPFILNIVGKHDHRIMTTFDDFNQYISAINNLLKRHQDYHKNRD